MPKIAYIDKSFRADSLKTIAIANGIIAEYARQGFALTLRQLYYQLVSRDYIENTLRSYKNLGNLIDDARMAGLIDWDAIVDRTRNLQQNSHWDDAQHIIQSAAAGFKLDKWAEQPCRVECWIEKDALIGVIEGVCRQLDIPYFACRGYTSQSEMWAAGQRLKAYYEESGQDPIIIHLGDHDPSGKDMTRDIEDRLRIFTEMNVEVYRLALNWDQIQQYQPPPNPAKLTDSRADGYIAEFGYSSWELDALPPTVIRQIIENAVRGFRDEDLWNKAVAEEKEIIAQLKTASRRWNDVTAYLNNSNGKPTVYDLPL